MYASIATKLIGGGIAGGLNASAQNDERAAQLAAYANLPAPPNYNTAFQQGLSLQNQAAPQQLAADYALRKQYIPRELSQSLTAYGKDDPWLQSLNLQTLHSVDPQYLQLYRQLSNNASNDLASGSQLTPDQLAQANAYIGGAQAARGNILGNSPVAANSLYDAQLGQQLYQQRIANAQTVMNSGGPESRFGQIGGNAGQAALSQGLNAFTSPGATYYQMPQNWGQQYVTNAYSHWQGADQNALAQANAAYHAAPQVNPWLASLSAASGAMAGMGSSPYGGAAGPSGASSTSSNPLSSYMSGF